MSYTTLLKAVTEIALIEARTKLELEAIGDKYRAELRTLTQAEKGEK